ESLAEILARSGGRPNPDGAAGTREALALMETAVEVRRKLAEASPDAFLPYLAKALTKLGIHLSSFGRREEQLAATQEAVEQYRQLAEANPDACLPGLAMALNNLGSCMSSMGRREDALGLKREGSG